MWLGKRQKQAEVFRKKGVLRNFAKITGKHLCQSFVFNKFAGFRIRHGCFPVNFAKFLRTLFLTKYFTWLLLKRDSTEHFSDVLDNLKRSFSTGNIRNSSAAM